MNRIKSLSPVLAAAFTLAADCLIPDSSAHPVANRSYFSIVMAVLLALMLVLFFLGLMRPVWRERREFSAPFHTGVILFLCLLNLLTAKAALLPVLYFPSLDRVFGVLVEDTAFLVKCLLYSLRLQVMGWLCGAVLGILTGVAIGFSKRIKYWIYPLVRVLGPIPSTAWIPLALVSFPSVVSASAFLIAIAVWFPTTVLTSSGIASIQNAYFEAAATLGASKWYTILRVGIPAAMPHMFIGLFNGTTASFITLVTAEMLGAKYGIGWYINWQKDMMSYANVYAGLIVMSVICYCIITLLFRLRDRLLVWQKGVIKW